MIDIKTKIHDRYAIEFKVAFVARRKLRYNDFDMGMWIFVPNSLDINSATYSKSAFYQDVKSNIRMITPRFLLRDIAGGEATPLKVTRKALSDYASEPTNTNASECEHLLKMFAAIVKSSIREETTHLLSLRLQRDIDLLCKEYVANMKLILDSFHGLRDIINTPTTSPEMQDTYRYADEFICTIVGQHVFKLLKAYDREDLRELLLDLSDYRRTMGYITLSPENKAGNDAYVYRYGILKKFVESQLFLRVPKKKDGVLAEQVYYSLAAGLAMIFATCVAWAFQSTFGNLTWPLFIALIISYMMKDRIKELMRFYFSHRVGSRYFDNKAKIRFAGKRIGSLKEAMDFISPKKVPANILEMRRSHVLCAAQNRFDDEKILLYRKRIHLDRNKMEEGSSYIIPGVNDIMRLNVNSFLHKMDNPECVLDCLDADGKPTSTTGSKYYYLYMVLQYTYDNTTEYKQFRITLTRDGIESIEEEK